MLLLSGHHFFLIWSTPKRREDNNNFLAFWCVGCAPNPGDYRCGKTDKKNTKMSKRPKKEISDPTDNKYVNVCYKDNENNISVAIFHKDELPALFSKAVDAVAKKTVEEGKTQTIVVDSSNGYFDGIENIVSVEDACAILRAHNEEELEEKDGEDGEDGDEEDGDQDPSDYVRDNIDEYVEDFIEKVRAEETKFNEDGGRSLNGHAVCTIMVFQD